jgi:hypothetical protein
MLQTKKFSQGTEIWIEGKISLKEEHGIPL